LQAIRTTFGNLAWYIRIPDLPDFIQTISPALEKRLAGGPLQGYSGEVKLGFYRSGLRIAFKDGHLVASEAWQPDPDTGGDARFPDLTFLSLLSGRRSLKELEDFFDL